MKTLYLDCGMGAAGDMLTAALLELIPDQDAFIEKLNALGIPGVEYKKDVSEKCGVVGTRVTVTVDGIEESSEMFNHHDHHDHDHVHHHDHEHDHEHHDHHHDHEHHDHEHDHDHEHTHHHGTMHEIEHLVRDHMNVPESVADNILAVYDIIAKAESEVHGVPVTDIHFHEVGTKDALADVSAVCLLMDEIAPDEVVVSPVHVGCGKVQCAHGILPVPAPATANILKGVPIYGGKVEGELCTPTGAALLKFFATRFGNMPVMTVSGIGYGMGKRDFPVANTVRALLGENEYASTAEKDEIIELSCNVDDMTGEDIGFAIDMLLEDGAREAFTVPVYMKKGRPGVLIKVLCLAEDEDKMVRLLFKHTSTIGIRKTVASRYVLSRNQEIFNTELGSVRIKTSEGYGVTKTKYESDDICRIAREQDMSPAEVRAVLDTLQ